MKTIEKNFKKNTDLFMNLSDDDIYVLYDYITTGKEKDIKKRKKRIQDILDLDAYKDNISFIYYDILNEDDTVKDVLSKITIHCCCGDPMKHKIIHTHMYAWYKNKKGINQSLGFTYRDSIKLDDMNLIDDRLNTYEDTRFVSEEGERVIVPREDKLLYLLENCRDIKDDIIYFCSIEQFMRAKDIQGVPLIDVLQDEARTKQEKTRLIHSILLKYWPNVELSEILEYGKMKDIRETNYQQERVRYLQLSKSTDTIESKFFENESRHIPCMEHSIQMMKLTKEGGGKNIVNLSKLFRDVRLTDKIPFMKLMLESRDDILFKVNNNHIVSEGKSVTEETYITKDICKKWSDDLIIYPSTGYRYLHKENVILMKIYDKSIHKYTTLVLHLNGDIECVFNETGPQTTEKDILILIKRCNEVIRELNQQAMYSFESIPELDDDIYENEFSDTKLDFKNCHISFRKSNFEDKKKQILPDFLQMFGTFLHNFPMYFRMKLAGEVDESSQRIMCRYKRVNNYANLETIHSFISVRFHADKSMEQDEIIEELKTQFSIEHDKALQEYLSWKETTQIQLQNLRNKNINPIIQEKLIVKEPGAEMTITSEDDLVFTIKDITSFSEYHRIIMFIKTMVLMYHDKIKELDGHKEQLEFTEVKSEINKMFHDDPIIERDDIERDDIDDDSYSDGTHSDMSDLFSDEEEEIDYNQLGGSGEMYETKSYYLNRLKSRDPELFKFKSRKKQPSGVRLGYPKYCQTVDARMPIVVSKDELDRINNATDKHSGPDSYKNAVRVPKRGKKTFYICPKYWDISKNLSILPDYIDSLPVSERDKIVIPNKFPSGTKGKTNRYILQRTGKYWNEATEIKYFKAMITAESHRLHPDGYGLPCCFNISKQIRRGDETGNQKPTTTYISKADPAEKDKYAHIHPELVKIFHQEGEDLLKKSSRGFIKKGVLQNKSKFLFDISPFLESYQVISGYQATTEDFIQELQEKLEKDLTLFQRCPLLIHAKFRKTDKQFIRENKDYILKILRKKQTKECFQIDIIHTLIDQINSDDFDEFDYKKNEMAYVISLISTMRNYCNYLRSNEERGHLYIVPVLSIVYPDINPIIFENIDETIVIKETDWNSSNKYGFIYKRGTYYEPILYRIRKQNELKNFTQSSVTNNHLDKIVMQIHKYVQSNLVKSSDKECDILDFLKKIKETGDILDSLYLNHYSQVSYLYTKQRRLISIRPCQIPRKIKGDKEYKFIYDFIGISDVNKGDKVSVTRWNNKGQKRTQQGTVVKKPWKNSPNKRWRIEIKSDDGISISKPFSSVCFIKNEDTNDCYINRPSFHSVIGYTKYYKGKCGMEISGLIVSQEDESGEKYIVCLVMSNDTFIPIIDELYDKLDPVMNRIPIKGNHDLLDLESVLREKKEINDCQALNDYLQYETYIMKLSHYHLIYLLNNASYSFAAFTVDETNYQQGYELSFQFIKQGDKYQIREDPQKNTLQGTIQRVINETNYIISVPLIDYISTIIKDPIMIVQDKKKEIKKILFDKDRGYIHKTFYEMEDSKFNNSKEKHNKNTYLCIGDHKGHYPCYKDGDTSKLIIKETDYDKKNLIHKIVFRFVDLLLIHETHNMNAIIQEHITVAELINMRIMNEDIYSYNEYRSNYLDVLFKGKSKFINEFTSQQTRRHKMNTRILDENPYYIRELYGEGTTITYMNETKNMDFKSLALAINELLPDLGTRELKNLLIDELKERKDVVELYRNGKVETDGSRQKEYKKITDIKTDIESDEYSIDFIDLELIISSLYKRNGYAMGILLFSQKYNQKKVFKEYFSGDIVEKTTPIISLCHSSNKDKERYDLSIIINGGKYSRTVSELHNLHNYFKKKEVIPMK